jgi:enoyl-CoA hydratase/carnithine racemase
MAGRLTVEQRGTVALLTLSNPAKRNALDPSLCQELVAALPGLAPAGVRAAVLTGDEQGKAFCAGFDLEALAAAGAGDSPSAADELFEEVLLAMAACPVPIVGALGGAAMGGGCELAAACDVRVAHATVKLGLPPARLGIVYAPRGLARLAAICGESRARQLFLLARTVAADEAHGWGLVDFLVGEHEVLPRALALAGEISELAPLAVQGMRVSFEAILRRRIALEGADAADVRARREAAWRSADAAEGRRAVSERRKPDFRGV